MSGYSLRIMTYNAHHGSGNDDCVNPVAKGEIPPADCSLDLPRLAGVINTENPEIVALQEIDRFWARSDGKDQPKELEMLLGMDSRFGANLVHEADTHADVEHEYGVATFTPHPITRCKNYLLPTTDGWEQRGMLDTRIDVPEIGEVALLNTHLQVNLGGDPKDAVRQRRAQAKFIADHVSSLDIPTIVIGDMNTEMISGDIDPIFEAGSGMKDVWTAAGTGDGYTILAAPHGEAYARIDYILVSSHFNVVATAVVDNHASRMASDHLPVIADLEYVRVDRASVSTSGD